MKKAPLLFSVLLVIIVSACLPLPARERRGATVLVTMSDGSRIEGELLKVKMDTMIIYDPGPGKGWDLDLQQVTQVRIKRDSKFLLGTIVGLAVGLRLSEHTIKAEDKAGLFYGSQSALMVPMASLLCGFIAGIASRDKKISLAGESSPAEQENRKRLKRYARELDPVQSPGLH